MEPAPEPVTSIASQPQLRSWHPPLSADVTDHSTRYGPFPKTTVQIHTGKEASINHANVPMAEIPMAEIDNENTGSNEAILTDMKKGAVPASKGEYASIKQVISDNRTADMLPIRNRQTENAPLSDDTTIMASAIKSKLISTVSPLQHVPISPSSSAMTLAPMTDIEHHGSFSGQQHNGQQNNQQNPQQGQADPMLDTRMSLDQGKDGRLLRLNMNDANWTDRLLRNIQSNPVKGSDETIQVILEPAKLGRLVVQISITGNNTNVQITSATAEAAAILADAEPRLQQELEQHGLKLGQMQTSMGQGFSNQWSQGQGSSSSERNNKTGTKNATQDEEQSTKILENDKTGQVNILA